MPTHNKNNLPPLQPFSRTTNNSSLAALDSHLPVPHLSSPSPTESTSKGAFQAERGRRVVFVDPEDDGQTPWWWPAMVIPRNELPGFRQSMDNDVDEPEEGNVLVCYFEDGSYNIVPESATKPFDVETTPYITWLSGSNGDAFRNDNAVILATRYYNTGIVPSFFAWLRDVQSDFSEDEITYTSNRSKRKSPTKDDRSKKKSNNSGYVVSAIGTSERKASLSSLASLKRESPVEDAEPTQKKAKRGSTVTNTRTKPTKSKSPVRSGVSNDSKKSNPSEQGGSNSRTTRLHTCSNCGTQGNVAAKILCDDCCNTIECKRKHWTDSLTPKFIKIKPIIPVSPRQRWIQRFHELQKSNHHKFTVLPFPTFTPTKTQQLPRHFYPQYVHHINMYPQHIFQPFFHPLPMHHENFEEKVVAMESSPMQVDTAVVPSSEKALVQTLERLTPPNSDTVDEKKV